MGVIVVIQLHDLRRQIFPYLSRIRKRPPISNREEMTADSCVCSGLLSN